MPFLFCTWCKYDILAIRCPIIHSHIGFEWNMICIYIFLSRILKLSVEVLWRYRIETIYGLLCTVFNLERVISGFPAIFISLTRRERSPGSKRARWVFTFWNRSDTKFKKLCPEIQTSYFWGMKTTFRTCWHKARYW